MLQQLFDNKMLMMVLVLILINLIFSFSYLNRMSTQLEPSFGTQVSNSLDGIVEYDYSLIGSTEEYNPYEPTETEVIYQYASLPILITKLNVTFGHTEPFDTNFTRILDNGTSIIEMKKAVRIFVELVFIIADQEGYVDAISYNITSNLEGNSFESYSTDVLWSYSGDLPMIKGEFKGMRVYVANRVGYTADDGTKNFVLSYPYFMSYNLETEKFSYTTSLMRSNDQPKFYLIMQNPALYGLNFGISVILFIGCLVYLRRLSN
ncbi:MAG: hypothetical protein INQ03_22310 [Candidatus Heimdallarchaeota archaeon]|nr:hypothetical protein [Candidatus Heimdallarchaeota archaeon]